jgi:pyruvate/2-oxoglutarate dehydrogenase complex dihydrolipoamide dehydrogenase (E3) component
VLLGNVTTGDNIVVAGGGEVGSETAAHLAMQQRKVTIVEMLPDIMQEMDGISKFHVKAIFNECGVQAHVNSTVREIADGHVIIERNGERMALAADTVVLALGYKPLNLLADTIKDVCGTIKVIGGAVKTSNALIASREGFDAGLVV